MPVAVRQITSDINVASSSAEFRRVLNGAPAPRLEDAVEHLRDALEAPRASTRKQVLTRAWQWRLANRPDDSLLRTLLFSSAAADSGITPTDVALELRVGTSILDCALLTPGSAEAVEIKSGLDSMARLPDQIQNYRAAFPRVTLLGDQRSSSRLSAFANAYNTGLVVARKDGSRWRLETVRSLEPDWQFVELRVVLSMLRTGEMIAITRSIVGHDFSPRPVNVYRDVVAALSSSPISTISELAFSAIRARRNISARSLNRDIPLSIRATIAEINPQPEQLSDLRDWLSAEV